MATTTTPQGNPVGRWFGDRKVNTKILLSVATASVVALGVGGTGITELGAVDRKATEIYEQGLLPLVDLAGLEEETLQAQVAVFAHATSLDEASMAEAEAGIAAGDAELDEALETYAAHTADPQGLEELTRLIDE